MQNLQIAAIKWVPKYLRYKGKSICSHNGIKNQTYEENWLETKWVESNFNQDFLANVREKSFSRKKYCLVPPVDTQPHMSTYTEVDTSFPRIYYLGTGQLCLTCSFASCLHYMSTFHAIPKQVLIRGAEEIHKFGISYPQIIDSTPDKFIGSLVDFVQRNKTLNRYVVMKRLPDDYNPFDDAMETKPVIIHLLDMDGSIGHAITIYKKMIFNSKLDHAIVLSAENLNMCCGKDHSFIGIYKGYYMISQSKECFSKRKRKRKKKRDNSESLRLI